MLVLWCHLPIARTPGNSNLVLICFEKLVVERKEETILKSDDCWNTVRGRGKLSNSNVPEA